MLFRGSFNPFHEGHLSVVRELLSRGYETVVVSPVTTSPGKGTIDTPVPLRAEMIEKVLRAEGVPVAEGPDGPGVYIVRSRSEARSELRRALLSRADFALGEDNDATYGSSKRWRLARKIGEDRIVVVNGSSPVHSSDIRAGRAQPHPAIGGIIRDNNLFGLGSAPKELSRFGSAVVLYNPISGSGKAQSTAQAIAASLGEKGLPVELRATSPKYSEEQIAGMFRGAGLAVVVGGDGTMMSTLPALAASGTPVYMVPGGNESLFSKLFSMKKDPAAVTSDLERRDPKDHYYGMAGGKPFFLMTTIGFDAAVLETIGERKGPSSNWMYVKAGLSALMRYRTPVISLSVDGKEVLDNERGYLIVGNSNIFARNLELVPEASSSEPKLTARFFPQSGIFPEIAKAIRMALRRPMELEGSKLFSGERLELTVHNGPYPMQSDGEYVGLVSRPIVLESSKDPIRILEG